jgi:hypothetical protein
MFDVDGRDVFEFAAELWLYPGDGGWHFVTLPTGLSDDIAQRFGQGARGFGSIPVEVTIGETIWTTSVFPDKKAGAYLLPVKGTVRKAEGLADGERVSLRIQVIA